ncbi:hypothetical protein K210_04335 [Erysipelothrix rhusiopathiae SY1027]|uniref:hypothetical protein n=1 Tax=Erysipelothrix rhusiopathiae TaxID=1648 RepID=UPI000334821C|nr:hypothetical protein [Erysipelothrix rhusiopathiae]AGN24472.1 hypothetical protein K210_04335 [Erysipelothrix rhusiopathiae SY1027]
MTQQNIEIREAISAGEQLLYQLEQSRAQLKKASDWGLFDMFGGGMFVTMIKHNRINEAKQHMNDAQFLLQRFSKELRDVHGTFDDLGDLNGFWTFADYFMDGFFCGLYGSNKNKQCPFKT